MKYAFRYATDYYDVVLQRKMLLYTIKINENKRKTKLQAKVSSNKT